MDGERSARAGLAGESPRHGYQGDRGAAPEPAPVPKSLTVTVSREAGARGGSIGHRVGRKLGWQVYDQELLEYVAQEGAFRQDVLDNLGAEQREWIEETLRRLREEGRLSGEPAVGDLARVLLALGAQGDVVIIGRGAGFLLPRASTLAVRVVAPLEDRVAYMSQWLRMTAEEAAERVRVRDASRNEFLETHFRRRPGDVYHYDLVLNSAALGEESCAELIAHAARVRLAAFRQDAP